MAAVVGSQIAGLVADYGKGRYEAQEFSVYPLDNGFGLVCRLGASDPQILPADLIRFLAHCHRFRTMEEHASTFFGATFLFNRHRRVASIFGGLARTFLKHTPQFEEFRTQLCQLAESGLLIAESEVLGVCRARDPGQRPISKIPIIGIPTRDRPQVLARALESYSQNCRKYGRVCTFLVADLSAPRAERVNRKILSSIANSGLRTFHIAREERNLLAAKLIEAGGFPPEIINFCLFNEGRTGVDPGISACLSTHGACRNTLLLCSAGDPLVSVDDDTICSIGAPPQVLSGVVLSSEPWPVEFWFEGYSGDAKFASAPIWDDFVGLHERLLGKSFPGCANAEVGSANLDDASPGIIAKLLAGKTRVLVTSLGVRGDCGFGSPSPYLWLRGASRQRLTDSEGNYRTAIKDRRLIMTARRPTVSDSSFCMAINLGIDNRELIPPFPPVQRNEDGVFRLVLGICFDEVCSGHIPWTIQHEPVPHRFFDDIWKSAGQFRSCDLMVPLIQSFRQGSALGSDAPARLRRLGSYLAEIGSLNAHEFDEFLRAQLFRTATSLLTEMEKSLREAGRKPTYWERDMTQYMGSLRKALLDPDITVPSDLPGSALARRELLARLIYLYGKLLQIWPDIIAVAKQLRLSGEVYGRQE